MAMPISSLSTTLGVGVASSHSVAIVATSGHPAPVVHLNSAVAVTRALRLDVSVMNFSPTDVVAVRVFGPPRLEDDCLSDPDEDSISMPRRNGSAVTRPKYASG